jgi:EAL domain-containing protein (putative c-di-GMP-specific phosphodiesterase class I)
MGFENCMHAKQRVARKGFDPVVMAVNLSVEQFRGNRLIEVIEKALEESRLDPKFLELEITESVAIKEPSYIVKVLQDMKALGVSISIDDFGTEYSSLSRLKELPIDRLKLAMEFVRGIGMEEKDEAIAMVIINLAKSLGMRVIAEGVEKETQLNFLKSRVCDEVQGFYFYHPMPADEVEKIMLQS